MVKAFLHNGFLLTDHLGMQKPPKFTGSQDEYVKTALRLPAALHTELKDAAERNGHSMNAEILARLQEAPALARLDRIGKDQREIKAMVREMLGVIGDR